MKSAGVAIHMDRKTVSRLEEEADSGLRNASQMAVKIFFKK